MDTVEYVEPNLPTSARDESLPASRVSTRAILTPARRELPTVAVANSARGELRAPPGDPIRTESREPAACVALETKELACCGARDFVTIRMRLPVGYGTRRPPRTDFRYPVAFVLGPILSS